MDFFTPIVDDPFWFGQIAAANALSDVYAMGGRPAVAMNLLCVPGCLSQETIRKILEGGHQKAVEAGCVIAIPFRTMSRNTACASRAMSARTGCCGTWAQDPATRWC